MAKKPPVLHLVPQPSRLQFAFEARVNAQYIYGNWENVLCHRKSMLERDYQNSEIPASNPEGRMDELKANLLEAISSVSTIRSIQFPTEVVRELCQRIGLANVVKDFVEGEGETAELADKNREHHFKTLVDTLWNAVGILTDREEVVMWLYDKKRPCPGNSDLICLAVFEINADLIGAALPRVLVLPNFHFTYNPFFIYVDDSVRVDAETAKFLRLLFSR